MFLRNAWYAAGWSADFGESLKAVKLLNEPIVFYRTTDQVLTANEDRCPHRLAPLSIGRREGDALRCLYHGLLFGPDGRCIHIPGQEIIPDQVKLRNYPVVERHGVAWIWMGEPANVDENLIPPFQGPNHPDWAMIPGRMDYEANYQLINDNLLDLSHISWVHAASFGGGDAAANDGWADIPVKIRIIDRGVRVERWAQKSPVPPYLRDTVGSSCDIYSSYDFLVPGIFILKTQMYAPGTAAGLSDGAVPEVAPVHQSFTCQAVTPLTDKTSCYFFGFGPEAQNSHLAQAFHDLAIMAFTEDRVMIEAQQRVIDTDPARKMMALVMDGAPKRYAGVVARLMKEEAGING